MPRGLQRKNWREIPGFHEKYIISNKGIVMRVEHSVYKDIINQVMLKPLVVSQYQGYVRLRNPKNGMQKRKAIKNLMRDIWGVYDFEVKQTAQDG